MHLPRDVRLSLPPTPSNGGEISRVDGTLAHCHRGGNVIAELGPSFSASSVHSLPPKAYHGGELQRVYGTLVRLFKDGTSIAELGQSFIAGRFSPSPPIILGEGASLAEHRAATVLQCWKRRIWLRCWFDQQALLKQKRLRLQALCRGASTYASSVRGNRRPPPTPTEKSSDPKVLNHPFRSHGQLLPPRKLRR